MFKLGERSCIICLLCLESQENGKANKNVSECDL